MRKHNTIFLSLSPSTSTSSSSTLSLSSPFTTPCPLPLSPLPLLVPSLSSPFTSPLLSLYLPLSTPSSFLESNISDIDSYKLRLPMGNVLIWKSLTIESRPCHLLGSPPLPLFFPLHSSPLFCLLSVFA